MMEKTFLQKNIKGLLLLLLAVAAFCCLWLLSPPSPKGGFTEKELQEDGLGTIRLHNKKLSISGSDRKLLWSSEKGHLVQDFLLTDLDRDSEKELIVLLWKRGKYGEHRPFWVTEDEKSYSQHIFIYSISFDGTLRQKWCASDVGREIFRFKLMEKNPSILLTEDVDGKCCLWSWNDFGLKLMENGAEIVAFGDNLIHREIYEYAYTKENRNFDYLYEPFLDDIKNADIAAFQQESMLVDKETAVGGYPSFGSPIEVGEALVKAGFDVACCAGNHTLDRGMYGIDVTTMFYSKENVLCLGVQGSDDSEYRPFNILTRNGISFALMDYSYRPGGIEISKKYPHAVHFLPKEEDPAGGQKLTDEVRSARKSADCVIIFVHWGNEYEKDISAYQKYIAALLAEGGADLVIGTHPHVVQEVSLVDRPDGGKMLVYYSLGNFRAHQGFSDETQKGGEAIIRVEHCFDGVRIADHQLKEIDAYP